MPLDGTSPKDSGFRWTQKAVDKLRELAEPAKALCASDIAEELALFTGERITRNAVIGKMRRLHLPLAKPHGARHTPTRLSSEVEEQIAALFSSGVSRRQIAGKLEISRSAIANKIVALGIGTSKPASRFRWNAELDARLRELSAARRSDSSIAREFGCSSWSVLQRRKKLGIKAKQEFSFRKASALKTAWKNIPEFAPDPKPVLDDVWALLPTSVPVPLIEARLGDCRWPCGDPLSREFRFCGAPAIVGKSYCKTHLRLSIGTGTLSERRACDF